MTTATPTYRNFFEEELLKDTKTTQAHSEPRKRVEKQTQSEDRPKKGPKNKKNGPKKSQPSTFNEDSDPEQIRSNGFGERKNSSKQNSRDGNRNPRQPKSKWISKDKAKPADEEQTSVTQPTPTINAQNVVEKSSVLFTLWKSTQEERDKNTRAPTPITNVPNVTSGPKENKREPKPKFRDLQSNPSVEDLQNALFFESNTFEDGEIVLLPRTRGGFSYGKIQKHNTTDYCFYDESVSFKTSVYTVQCYSSCKSVTKEAPTGYIGKLNPDEKSNTPAEAETGEINKFVGEKPAIKDLLVVEFNSQLAFSKDEIVMVPRSSGGFTYGKLIQSNLRNCPLHGKEVTHDVVTWMVMVSMDKKKEVFAGSIGKVQKISANAQRSVFDRNGTYAQGSHDSSAPVEKLGRGHHRHMEKDEYAVSSRRRNQKGGDRRRRSDQDEDNDNVTLALPIVANPLETVTTQTTTPTTPLGISFPDDLHPAQAPGSGSSSSHHSQSSQEQSLITPDTVRSTSPSKQEKTEINNSSTTSTNNTTTEGTSKKIGGVLPIDKQEYLRSLFKDEKGKKHLIVLDGPNVAKQHGKNQEYSAEGIKIAIDYWTKKGHDCFAFLPQHYVSTKPSQANRTLEEYLNPTLNAKFSTTDIALIQGLIAKGSVILTPSQDYDDTYCIKYAQEHDGCIVSNDRYMDHVKKFEKGHSRGDLNKAKRWIREHVISFTFVRDDFLANPDFKFPAFASPLETS